MTESRSYKIGRQDARCDDNLGRDKAADLTEYEAGREAGAAERASADPRVLDVARQLSAAGFRARVTVLHSRSRVEAGLGGQTGFDLNFRVTDSGGTELSYATPTKPDLSPGDHYDVHDPSPATISAWVARAAELRSRRS